MFLRGFKKYMFRVNKRKPDVYSPKRLSKNICPHHKTINPFNFFIMVLILYLKIIITKLFVK